MYYGTTCCAPGSHACSAGPGAGYPPVICCPDDTVCAINATSNPFYQPYCGAHAFVSASGSADCAAACCASPSR